MSRIRTEISIESSESYIIKRKRYSIRCWCDACERIAIFVLPTEASFLAGLDPDTIVSLVYNGELHVCEFPRRGIYICLTSLCLRTHASDPVEPENHEEIRLTESLNGTESFIQSIK